RGSGAVPVLRRGELHYRRGLLLRRRQFTDPPSLDDGNAMTVRSCCCMCWQRDRELFHGLGHVRDAVRLRARGCAGPARSVTYAEFARPISTGDEGERTTADRGSYFPVKAGARFWTKWATPSLKSSHSRL